MRTKTTRRRSARPSERPNRMWPYLLFLALAALLLVFFLSGPRGTIRLLEQSKEKERLQQEIEALERTKAALDSEKVKLHLDAYIEKIAREQYNMKKEGEKVYKIQIDDKDK